MGFESPMKQHYSQTLGVNPLYLEGFESPMKQHYSQTTISAFDAPVLV